MGKNGNAIQRKWNAWLNRGGHGFCAQPKHRIYSIIGITYLRFMFYLWGENHQLSHWPTYQISTIPLLLFIFCSCFFVLHFYPDPKISGPIRQIYKTQSYACQYVDRTFSNGILLAGLCSTERGDDGIVDFFSLRSDVILLLSRCWC